MYHLYHTPVFILGGASFGEANKTFTLFTRELGLLTASATSVREERSKLRYGLQDFSLSDITLVRGRELWRITNATLIENLPTTFRSAPEAVRVFTRVFQLIRRLVAGEEKNERLFETVMEAFNFLKIQITNQCEYTNKTDHPPLPLADWKDGHPFADKNRSALFTTPLLPTCPPKPLRRRRETAALPLIGENEELRRHDSLTAEVEIVLVLRILYLLGYLAPRGEFGSALSDISVWNDTLLTEARSFRALALAEINHSLRQTQL